MDGAGLQLFAVNRKRRRDEMSGEERKRDEPAAAQPKKATWGDRDEVHDDSTKASSFAALGVPSWLVKVCRSVGIVVPTAIQSAVIPPLLSSPDLSSPPLSSPLTAKNAANNTTTTCVPRDVIGCAQTGSGKTAAFALPILSKLVEDPYGPFALVLTPSRELALQIRDQFGAFGAAAHTRLACIVGRCDIVEQGKELARAPHIIVATPGRLAHHLSLGVLKLDLGKLAFLVLDEADRLLEAPFAPDLHTILEAARGSIGRRRTLLFSATMPPHVVQGVTTGDGDDAVAAARTDADTADAVAVHTSASTGMKITPRIRELLALQNPLCVDVTPKDIRATLTVSTLKQQYVFMPAMVKNAYLWHILLTFIAPSALPASLRANKGKKGKKKLSKSSTVVTGREALAEHSDGDDDDAPVQARSVIVFTSTCRACQMVTEMLIELGIPCAPLHSVMPQTKRVASLAKFRSSLVPVLVATDVASRGLDIPTVDLVLNYDLPQMPSDYIHRVGRTARAGRKGYAISFVTQYDVELITTIETEVLHGQKMAAVPGIIEDEVLPRLTKVATAYHLAKTRLAEQGFEEAMTTHTARKKEAAARSREFQERE